jgi:probable H4MPT-linked C1 transfer pathway protein
VHPFEIQHALGELRSTLLDLSNQLGAAPGDLHAVTMTAELSQVFRTKREGVTAVLDALEAAFDGHAVHVYTVEGEFVSPGAARRRPLSVAASNWAATARWVATRFPDSVLIDVGSTTTDLIPITNGQVCAIGWTDPERLRSGELVYTGTLRTPVEAIVQQVPLWSGMAGVSAESFALVGDVHLWLGNLGPEEYTWPTPDRRPVSREYAAERLARVVCSDRETLADPDIDAIAHCVAEAQVRSIVQSLERIRVRHPTISTAVTTGMGAFIGVRAARSAGLEIVLLPDVAEIPPQAAAAATVAFHLAASLAKSRELEAPLR